MSHESLAHAGRLSAYMAAASAVVAGGTSVANGDVMIGSTSPTGGPSVSFLKVGEVIGYSPSAIEFAIGASTWGLAGGIGSGFMGRVFDGGDMISDAATGGAGWGNGFNMGSLAEGATGYLGFRIPYGGTYYGWIEVTRISGYISISRWAYESDAGTGIVAGSTGSGAVPGLGGLAALALGASGVRCSRHRVA